MAKILDILKSISYALGEYGGQRRDQQKRERTHGHRQLCGDTVRGRGWERVNQDIRWINGNGKKYNIKNKQL